MKFTLALLIAAVFVGCAVGCSDEEWAEYKQTYNKDYPNAAEDLRHHEVYCANLIKIEKHNELFQKGEVTWEMGVNQFTDMSAEDMAEWMG